MEICHNVDKFDLKYLDLCNEYNLAAIPPQSIDSDYVIIAVMLHGQNFDGPPYIL